jgi:cation-transporting P-type ATPase I
MASVTGLPQRASTVALISLVAVELGQTMVDSHAPLVLLTATGSFAAFTAMITTPGISQLLGCTPVGPLGWAQGLSTATAAILAVAVTNQLRSVRRGAQSPPMQVHPAPDEQPPGPSLQPPSGEPRTAPHAAVLKAASKAVPALKLVDQHRHLVPAEASSDLS